MSNIKKAFENGKAFIAFVTCGDPDLETTAKVVRAAVENGADLIEHGIHDLCQCRILLWSRKIHLHLP